MKRKILITSMLLMFVMGLGACAELNLNLNPHKTPYDQAVSFFADAWESYHKVWLTLDEERKTDWVNRYHRQFQRVGSFLQVWGQNPDDDAKALLWNTLKDELELLLLKMAAESKEVEK